MDDITKDDRNYYEILEVPANATFEQIHQGYQAAKNAYANESLAFYSLMTKDNCQNMMELVEQAYLVLSDPIKRKEYDQQRGLNITPPPGPESSYDKIYASASPSGPNDNAGPAPFGHSSPFDGENNAPEKQPRETITDMMAQRKVAEQQESIMATVTPATVNTSRETDITKLVAQKRFSLQYDVDPNFEQEIEQSTEFTGDLLRRIREYKNVDLVRLSEMTKISKTYLRNIENETWENLPAPVYVRGFVFQMAKCLKLDPNMVANSYVARMKALKQKQA